MNDVDMLMHYQQNDISVSREYLSITAYYPTFK